MEGVGTFIKDAWRLARPYFASSDERWSARFLLAVIIALNLMSVGLSVLFNFWRADFYNALQGKDWDAFISLILFYRVTDKGLTFGFTVLAFAHILVAIYEVYLQQWLEIRWRRWLTARFLDEWLDGRAYYQIGLTQNPKAPGNDNPDQRIAEDIRDFCDSSLTLTLGLLSRIVSLFSFLTILWGLSGAIELLGVSIPGYLFWVALIYAAFGTVFTHLIGRPLSVLNFRKQRVEADFRYALVRFRENSEGIALYRGEEVEKAALLGRFSAVAMNWRAIMQRMKLLNLMTVGYSQAAAIFPIVIIAPRYFAGAVQLGQMFQTVDAFGRVESALSWVINVYRSLAEWRAVVERLATFERSVIAVRTSAAAGFARETSPDGTLRLTDLTLKLPDGTKLLDGAALELAPNHSVVVTGRSGSGKSTLFRALAGIWPFGNGGIQMPANAFFLPQRPYIPLGSLRHVIAYPHPIANYSQGDFIAALEDAGIGRLSDQLDIEENWPQRLSGGEQQRVALARALLAKPDWIFLDEATASLDPAAEAALYDILKTRLPNATLISIAHRPSVAALHDRHIELRRDSAGSGLLAATVPAA